MGKSSEATVFKVGEPMVTEAGNMLTKNSSEAREVLDDLCILSKSEKSQHKLKEQETERGAAESQQII